jgi:hypothetical protein
MEDDNDDAEMEDNARNLVLVSENLLDRLARVRLGTLESWEREKSIHTNSFEMPRS